MKVADLLWKKGQIWLASQVHISNIQAYMGSGMFLKVFFFSFLQILFIDNNKYIR